jgi:SAM-dependent methyltransferase
MRVHGQLQKQMSIPHSPLTGMNNVVSKETLSASSIVYGYLRTYNVDTTNCFAGAATIQKWLCLDSGISFFTPKSCAGDAAFYRGLSRHEWYYMTDKWEYEASLKLLPRAGSVLEVGCGHGHFLDQCARRGLNVTGLELTPPDSGRSSAERIEILDETIGEHARTHGEKYDALCSFQVLEHIPEPKPFLEACCQAVKPGGKLILCTPNADSFLRHSRTLLDIPPHHITGWREQTFRYLEQILPLRFEQALFEPLAEYHVDFFIGTYRKKYVSPLDPRGIWAREPLASFSRKILSAGFRKLIRGQSILAVFARI